MEIVTRRRFTVDEFNKMGEVGLLGEDDRVELIDGEIVEMAPIGDLHMLCVNRLSELLVFGLSRRAEVSIQNPVRLSDDTELQPDCAILVRPEHRRRRGVPLASDVLLIVEVSDSTMDYDRLIKLPRYARAGIGEAWIVNLNEQVVEVYLTPRGDGYAEVRAFHRGEVLAPAAFSDLMLSVEDILPSE